MHTMLLRAEVVVANVPIRIYFMPRQALKYVHIAPSRLSYDLDGWRAKVPPRRDDMTLIMP